MRGGKSFLCLKSTAAGTANPLSTIIPNLGNGAKVTTPSHHLQHAVSEYGVADLSLMTDRERPRAMIKLAHPDFRPWLEESLRG